MMTKEKDMLVKKNYLTVEVIPYRGSWLDFEFDIKE